MADIRERLAVGRQLHDAGQLETAEGVYRELLQTEPHNAELLQLLGVLLLQRGAAQEAIPFFKTAVAAEPNNSQLHSNLGAAYSSVGRPQEALAIMQHAVALAPEYPEARYNLGLVLFRLGRLDEAIACYRECLRLNPTFAAAHRNLGVALRDLARLDEARECFERTCQLEPQQPASHINLGTLLKDRGDLEGAIACYEAALRLDPGNSQALVSRATARLAMGQFAAGWADYEHRIGNPEYNTLRLNEPQWDGTTLDRRTLLVHCEQGLGDTLQFIRYAAIARARAARVVIACQPALIPLLSQSGFMPVISRNETLGSFDVQAPLLSLPYILGTTLETIPREVPYLAIEQRRIERWRGDVDRQPGFKIGIAWQGQTQYRADRLRSIPLKYFARLADVPGVRLFSLQKGPGTEQLTEITPRRAIVDLSGRIDEDGAFLDTAAVMHSLDLVIASDTAVGHLAGALGVPVWLALSAAPDWRWMLERTDTPWYPSMRLFRQQKLGDWQGVFEEMAAELSQGGLMR